jgi:SAM-dependent methyltransferase
MSEPRRPSTVSATEWDERYRSGDLPWDTQRPSPELIRVLDEGFVPSSGRALELGCGTGTNAIYLAQRGFQVTALDLSAVAIDRARQRSQAAAVRVDFFADDVASAPMVAPFDFVFDRGCYHCVRRVNLAGYIASVERLTHPGTKFLLLAGNANEDGDGPPRVHEQEIRAEFGPLFDIQWIRSFRFEDPDGVERYLGWSVGMVRREV